MQFKRVCEHSFLQNLLGNPAVVLDCGANHGDFSRWISDNCSAVVHGFEPDPRLFPELPILRNVEFHPVAISATGKPLELNLGMKRCGTAYFPEYPEQETVIVKSIKLDEFCDRHSISHIDLIKMDIEGSEIEVLNGLPDDFLKKIGQITVEFHDFIDKSDLPRIHYIISKLHDLGFMKYQYSYSDHSDILFINQNIHKIKNFEKIMLIIIKYFTGITRLINRYIKC